MALSSSSAEHNSAGSSTGGKVDTQRGVLLEKEKKQKDAIQFRAASFVNKIGTGEEFSDYSGGQKKERNPWTNLTREDRHNYTEFLTSYISGLAKVYNERRDLLKKEEIVFFESIAKDNNSNIRTDWAEPDNPAMDQMQDKIQELLNTPRGYVLALMAQQRMNEEISKEYGDLPLTNAGPKEDEPLKHHRNIPLNRAEGRLGYPMRKFIEWWGKSATEFDGREAQEVHILNTWWPWIGLPRRYIGIPAIEIGGHKLALPIGTERVGPWELPQKPWLPIIGRRFGFSLDHLNRAETAAWLTIGGLATAAAEAAFLGVSGLQLPIAGAIEFAGLFGTKISAAALAVGFGIPTAAEAASILVGRGLVVDNTDLDVHPSNTVRGERPSRPDLKTELKGSARSDFLKIMTRGMSPEAIIKQRNSNVKAILALTEHMGGDQARVDALEIGFLFNPDGKGNPGETMVKYAARIASEFKADEGGIVDRSGQPRMIRNRSGELVPNRRFKPDDIDISVSARNYDEARSEVWMEYLRDYTNEQLKKDLPPEEQWSNKKKAREKGVIITERRRELARYRTLLESDGVINDQERSVFENYNFARQSLENDYLELKKRGVSDLEPVIKDRIDQRDNRGRAGSYALRKARIEEQLEARIDTLREDLVDKGWEGDDLSAERARRRERWDKFYGNELQKLENEVGTALKNEIAELEGLRDSVSENQNKISQSGDLTRGVEENSKFELEAFAKIRAWGLSENQLRTETIDQLMARINARTGNGRWPNEENDLPENRLLVLRAMVEARSRQILSTFGGRVNDWRDRFEDYTNPLTWGLTENQLKTMTVESLTVELSARAGPLGLPEPTEADVQHAVNEANARLQSRIEASSNLKKEIDQWIKNIDEENNKLPEMFASEIAQLQVTEDLLKGSVLDRITANASSIIANRARFTDTSTIAPDDRTYTEAEKGEGVAKGYYEFLDYMFDYKKKSYTEGETRETYFDKLYQVITPDRIMELMSESFGPSIGEAPTDFNDFLTKFNNAIERGRISEHRLIRAFVAIMDSVKDEGRALP